MRFSSQAILAFKIEGQTSLRDRGSSKQADCNSVELVPFGLPGDLKISPTQESGDHLGSDQKSTQIEIAKRAISLDNTIETDAKDKDAFKEAAIDSDQQIKQKVNIASRPVLMRARTSYVARKSVQLSFERGDVVRVVNSAEKWHSGVLIKSSKYPVNHTRLYYPPNFFEALDEQQSEPFRALLEDSDSKRYMKKPSGSKQMVARGNFKGSKSNQMSFAKGDIILITQTEGNWYKGILQQSTEYSITGVVKFVPKNYLRDM